MLAALGTGTTAAVAGCSTVLGASGPRSLNPADVVQDSPLTRVWEFPRGASDANTPVQTHLEQAARVSAGTDSADVRFRFGATVFDHSQYHHDRITLRVRAPATRQGDRTPADVFVHPLAGGFTSFRTYQHDGETVLSVDDLETDGTLLFEFLVHPRTGPTPEALGYEFEVLAENSNRFGRNAVASDSGQVPVVRDRR